jgi:hypothetical protein
MHPADGSLAERKAELEKKQKGGEFLFALR